MKTRLTCEFMNGLDNCNNEANAKISFDFARNGVPFGNRMKDRKICDDHLELQKNNHHILNLEINEYEAD